eukprot:54308_1
MAEQEQKQSNLESINNGLLGISKTIGKNWSVGNTLDVELSIKPPPFEDETLLKFINAYKDRLKNYDPTDSGEYGYKISLVQDEKEQLKSLDVDGKLDFSYGPVSGDASVNFAMNNSQNSLQLTFIVNARQSGRLLENDLGDRIPLKLKDSVLKKIEDPNYTFDKFKKEYGSYFIVGFDYGGEILFQSKYSVNSSQNKLSVAGGLSVSYGKMGFNISGAVNGDYKSEDIQKNTNIETSSRIVPSYDNDLLNGKDGILILLSKLADPLTNGIDEKSNENFFGDLNSKMQKYLSGKTLDRVNAVIIPISSVGCVDEAFSDKSSAAIGDLFKFSNELFLELKAINGATKTVNDNYDKYGADQKPAEDIKKWLSKTQRFMDVMSLGRGDKLYEYAKLRAAYVENPEEKEDTNELDKSDFYKVNKDILQMQFKTNLLSPYDKMMQEKGKGDDEKDAKVTDTLRAVQLLQQDEFLTSLNGSYKAVMQTDGNFVVYENNGNKVKFATNTAKKGSGPYVCAMQADNNLVVYGNGKALWASHTDNKGEKSARCVMQNDGNLVVYDSKNNAIWSSNK